MRIVIDKNVCPSVQFRYNKHVLERMLSKCDFPKNKTKIAVKTHIHREAEKRMWISQNR